MLQCRNLSIMSSAASVADLTWAWSISQAWRASAILIHAAPPRTSDQNGENRKEKVRSDDIKEEL